MALEECKNMHKYGHFIKDNNNEFHRVCLCCKKISYYPASLEIENEFKRQENIEQIFNYTINQDLISNGNGDDFLKLVSLIYDDLSYLNINQDVKDQFVHKINSCNQHFNKDNTSRLNLINEFLEYLDLFFKKEDLEIKYGIGSFGDDNYMELDMFEKSINDKFDSELELLYDLEEKKESSIKR